MTKHIEWQFYNSDNEAVESRRNLPHIDMPGALTFVTFRFGRLHAERDRASLA